MNDPFGDVVQRAVRILYGLSGDGLGHTMRARVVATHLTSQGHVVHMAACGRAASILRAHGLDVVDVRSLVACYEKGGISRAKTVARFMRETPARLGFNARVALREELRFHPDVVITDFNGFACAVAHAFGIPVVSLDHQHVLDRFVHPQNIIAPFVSDFSIARAAISAKTPRCAHYLVTSFFFPEERAKNRTPTTLIGPLVRPEVSALTPTAGDHVLVYQTASGDPNLLGALRANRTTEFRVYGARSSEEKIENVKLCAFDEEAFLRDLASARAVITNGGFSAISEALTLDKPILSVPLRHQAEQELNARWLEALGFGMRAERATALNIRKFLARISSFRSASDARVRTGTRDGLGALDGILKEVA